MKTKVKNKDKKQVFARNIWSYQDKPLSLHRDSVTELFDIVLHPLIFLRL